MRPPLDKSLVVAGAVLHDIGKLIELDAQPQGAAYSARGKLIGHILLGRDMVRDKASEIDGLDSEQLLRLEHIIISHQNLPEWGSPIAPHTPEALLVLLRRRYRRQVPHGGNCAGNRVRRCGGVHRARQRAAETGVSWILRWVTGMRRCELQQARDPSASVRHSCSVWSSAWKFPSSFRS